MLQLTKDEYYKKTELELKKIKTRIIELDKKIQKTEAGIKVRHNQKMGQIHGQHAQAKEKLNEIQTSQHDTWLKLKPMLDEDIELLDEAIEIISQRISVPSDE